MLIFKVCLSLSFFPFDFHLVKDKARLLLCSVNGAYAVGVKSSLPSFGGSYFELSPCIK